MGLFKKNNEQSSNTPNGINTTTKPKAKGSTIARVLREKHKLDTRNRNRKTAELNEIKSDALFRARMVKQLQEIDAILEDDAVYSVTIEVAERDISAFIKTIYREEMGAYDILQVDEYTFEIGKKEIYI